MTATVRKLLDDVHSRTWDFCSQVGELRDAVARERLGGELLAAWPRLAAAVLGVLDAVQVKPSWFDDATAVRDVLRAVAERQAAPTRNSAEGVIAPSPPSQAVDEISTRLAAIGDVARPRSKSVRLIRADTQGATTMRSKRAGPRPAAGHRHRCERSSPQAGHRHRDLRAPAGASRDHRRRVQRCWRPPARCVLHLQGDLGVRVSELGRRPRLRAGSWKSRQSLLLFSRQQRHTQPVLPCLAAGAPESTLN